MVSQTSSDEWQSPPPRPGMKLPSDCRQLQPQQSARNPPSYLDAVRSRHSLSQPDSSKLLRTINSQMQYNSLPRPLPQRLQGCPANGLEASRRGGLRGPEPSADEAQQHSSLRTQGFQVYTRPPGPANHVPLMGCMRPASSASLPRTLPSSRRDSREFQQPLSVIVQPNDFHDRSLKQSDKSGSLSSSEWSHMSNGNVNTMGRAPYFNGTANGDNAGPKERKHLSPQDPKKYLPNDKNCNGSLTLAQIYQQSRFPGYRGNSSQYPRYGTLPSRRPTRTTVPEPAVSLRTGPLGSYPDFNRIQADNPPALPTKGSQSYSKSINTQPNCNNGSLLEIDRQREYADSRSPPSNNGCNSLSPAERGSLYPLHETEHAFRRVVSEKSATLPTRKNRAPGAVEGFGIPPVNFRQSPPNIVRNGTSSHHVELGKPALRHQDPVVRNNNRDYYQASPQEKNPCHTPEDVGLVMIVEARDLNIKSKDLVKPTARMPTPQDGFTTASCNFANNATYGTTQHFSNSDPMPSFASNCTSGTYSTKEQSVSYLNASSSETGQSVSQQRALVSSSSKSYGDGVLRRTPLSSSTASLSSELSSVSSRHRHSESALERLRSSNRNGQSRTGATQKKTNASPSPWLREEKEQLQKQHIQGIRRAQDEEISYLESLPERSPEQEERLRVWLLEREFQRRAEEAAADEDEDEDEECLLERAELRERMLMMERSRDSTLDFAQSPKATSSSDQWLRTSQAKQQPKSNGSEPSSCNLNGSFDVQQLNDLLETMNMSPVIREPTSDDDTEVKNSKRDSEAEVQTTNKEQHNNNRPVFSSLPKSSSNVKALKSPCLEFCHSLNEANMVPSCEMPINQMPMPKEINHHPSAFTTVTAMPKKFSSNPIPEDFAFNTQPIPPVDVSLSDKIIPKMSTRNLLTTVSNHGDFKCKTVAETDSKINLKTTYLSKSKDYNNSIRNFVSTDLKEQDSPICKTIRELRSPDRSIGPGFGKKYATDFNSRATERKKPAISKPETLPFQDKIRIFSLKAGEENIPRDKVKNSRAQRELEVKFSSDSSKAALAEK